MNTGLSLLFSYVFLALGVLRHNGEYHPKALELMLVSFAWLACALFMAWRGGRPDRKTPNTLTFVLALLILLLLARGKPVCLYPVTPLLGRSFRAWMLCLSLMIAAAYGPLLGGRGSWIRRGVFWLAFAAAFALRLWVPFASPSPMIDTFTVTQESCAHLLEGENPYTAPVSNVYEGKVDIGYRAETYVYLPANLYLQTVGYWLTGDARFLYVAAEVVVALVLLMLAGRRWTAEAAELITLLFLYHPCGLLLIENAWTDPLILLMFSVFLWLHERHKDTWAAAAYGYMLGLKQYLIFFALHWLILERRWWRILLALAVAGLTTVPFLIADPLSLVRQGVLFNAQLPFREDSLTIFGFLSPQFQFVPPKSWSLVVGALVAVLVLLPVRRMPKLRAYLFAVTVTTYSMFLFGVQAFCNYYYLVAGLMLFLLAIGGKGEESSASA